VTRRLLAIAGCLWLAACDHTPAGSFAPPARGPLSTGNPHRVTYNAGADLRPSWLPDGSGFFYTRQRLDRADRDRCLGLLPADGGSLRDEICDNTPGTGDTSTTFESAAVAADGRMAYVRTSIPTNSPSAVPITHELRVGTIAAPPGVRVLSLPYPGSVGVHWEAEWLQWLSPTELIYLGEYVDYPIGCNGCDDPPRTGLEVVRLDPASGNRVFVAGTDSATSVAAVNGDSIYYTRIGSGQVLRRSLASASTAVATDFGAADVRDVSVRAGRLAAVTGPGFLWWVQLPSGTQTPLTAPGLVFFKRPALSPDGRRLVAEGYGFQIDTIRIPGDGIASIDTVTSRLGDLWVFDLP